MASPALLTCIKCFQQSACYDHGSASSKFSSKCL